MDRRSFLAAASAPLLHAAAAPIPVLDTHIHLFDTRRPQGVPWPSPRNPVLYRPALPERYRQVSAPFGVTGAIAVECSPWLEDNQWLLDTASQDPIVVAVVGNLEIADPDFPSRLERFARNPLFRGLRYGNLWGRDLASSLSNPQFVAGLKRLAGMGLSLDTADPDLALLAAAVRLSDLVPELRLILDHLPGAEPPADPAGRKSWYEHLRLLSTRPQVYVKVSHLLRRVNGAVPADLAFYRERIDEMWQLFGPDRLLYGSDWPNCDQWGPYSLVFRLVHDYFASKPLEAREKYFWRNSLAAYRWIPRTQPQRKLAELRAGANRIK
jgi:predicted TIM-barrel fold metal-dependent hydrolase